MNLRFAYLACRGASATGRVRSCLLGFRIAAVASGFGSAAAAGAESPGASNVSHGGSTVVWARLKTDDHHWVRHTRGDQALIEFFNSHTSLRFEFAWRTVDARELGNLCRQPFLFVENLAELRDSEERGHVGEYLRRGGFVFVSAYVDAEYNPDLAAFCQRQIDFIRAEMPAVRAETLPSEHELFSIYFPLRHRPPQPKGGEPRPLHALFLGQRLVGIVATNGIQCGWAQTARGVTSESALECVKMTANIYVYAMTR